MPENDQNSARWLLRFRRAFSLDPRGSGLTLRILRGVRLGFEGELLPLACKLHKGGLRMGFRICGLNARLARQLSVTLCALLRWKPRYLGHGFPPELNVVTMTEAIGSGLGVATY